MSSRHVAAAALSVALGCSTGSEPVEPAGQPSLFDAGPAVQRPPSSEPMLQLVDRFIEAQGIDNQSPGWRELAPPAPMLRFDESRQYRWHLKTNHGPLLIGLNPAAAPVHVSSTIYLTRLGFYDGLLFHRVIPNFVAQGGDPRGDGTGGPGYWYAGEFNAGLRHDRRGLISMANRGPDTDGSQFFILFDAQPHLDGRHTIFGEVIEGLETLAKIERLGSSTGAPRERVRIERATIEVR